MAGKGEGACGGAGGSDGGAGSGGATATIAGGMGKGARGIIARVSGAGPPAAAQAIKTRSSAAAPRGEGSQIQGKSSARGPAFSRRSRRRWVTEVRHDARSSRTRCRRLWDRRSISSTARSQAVRLASSDSQRMAQGSLQNGRRPMNRAAFQRMISPHRLQCRPGSCVGIRTFRGESVHSFGARSAIV
jgi:hypothetical protein